MGNVLFGWPLWADGSTTYTPTFSGGSWSATLPLTNLTDRRLAKAARSSTAAVADTQFDIDLKAARRVGVLALVQHTLSLSATTRFRGASSPYIFDSLTVGDAAWTNSGGLTRSAAAAVGTDNVALDLIGDASGAAEESTYRAMTFTANAQKIVVVRVKVGTSPPAAGSVVRMQDLTAPADRLYATITWAGAVPSVAMTTGTLVSSTAVVTGHYRLVFLTSAVTAANSHRLTIYPALAAANTGNIYIGDVHAWDAATEQLVYDTGYAAAWLANVYPTGALPVGDPRIGGTYTAEESLYVTVPTTTIIPSSGQTARYWRCTIADTSNAAGYVQIGRLVLADAYQPTVNLSIGGGVGWTDDDSTRTVTDGGAAIYGARAKRRVYMGALDEQAENELLARFFEMQNRVGVTEQLFFAHDSADTYHLSRRAFLAVFARLDVLRMPTVARMATGFSLVEER